MAQTSFNRLDITAHGSHRSCRSDDIEKENTVCAHGAYLCALTVLFAVALFLWLSHAGTWSIYQVVRVLVADASSPIVHAVVAALLLDRLPPEGLRV
jgi:hypothetical protein